MTDFVSYNTRQTKARQFTLTKTRSNSGAKIAKYSAVEIWLKIPLEINHI